MFSLRSLYVNMLGLWVTVSLAMFSGLTMFSIYKDCDPLTNGDVSNMDQVNPQPCSTYYTILYNHNCTLAKYLVLANVHMIFHKALVPTFIYKYLWMLIVMSLSVCI